MRTLDFIDAVKRHREISSDYACAQALGLTRAQLSRYRNGRDFFGDETAVKVADMLGLDAGYVMACIHAERASNPEIKVRWEGVAARLQRAGLGVVVAVLAVFLVGIAPTPADASPLQIKGASVYYVKWLRRLAATLRRLAGTFGAPGKSPDRWTQARVMA
jgi:hypothetical protein